MGLVDNIILYLYDEPIGTIVFERVSYYYYCAFDLWLLYQRRSTYEQ